MMGLPMLAADGVRSQRNQTPVGSGGTRGNMDPRCLVDAVEFDVIPRLLDAHRGENLWAEVAGPGTAAVSVATSVDALTDLVLDQKIDAAMALIEGLRARGSAMRAIYLDLLAASAHRLGQQWDDDEISFPEVTIGLCGLHQVMYRLSPDFRRETGGNSTGRRVLLAAAPQETHFFGVLMAADFFARAGWQVWTEVETDADRLAALIRDEDFDLVGFSISCDRCLDRVGGVIGDLRRTVRRPLRVIVGGSAVAAAPEHVARIGADAVARDAEEGLRLAAALLDNHNGRTDKTAPSSFID